MYNDVGGEWWFLGADNQVATSRTWEGGSYLRSHGDGERESLTMERKKGDEFKFTVVVSFGIV